MPPTKSCLIRDFFIYDVDANVSICQCELEKKGETVTEVSASDDEVWVDGSGEDAGTGPSLPKKRKTSATPIIKQAYILAMVSIQVICF